MTSILDNKRLRYHSIKYSPSVATKRKKKKKEEENSGRTDNTLSSSELFFVNVGFVGDYNVNASSHTPRDVRRSTSWHTRKCPLTNAFQRRPKSPRPNASRVWIPVFDPYRTEKSKNHAAARLGESRLASLINDSIIVPLVLENRSRVPFRFLNSRYLLCTIINSSMINSFEIFTGHIWIFAMFLLVSKESFIETVETINKGARLTTENSHDQVATSRIWAYQYLLKKEDQFKVICDLFKVQSTMEHIICPMKKIDINASLKDKKKLMHFLKQSKLYNKL